MVNGTSCHDDGLKRDYFHHKINMALKEHRSTAKLCNSLQLQNKMPTNWLCQVKHHTTKILLGNRRGQLFRPDVSVKFGDSTLNSDLIIRLC